MGRVQTEAIANGEGAYSHASEDAFLQNDDRWQLVQRILASPGLQRADQLRKILIYISRSALLQPSKVIREYEIACEVLLRRADFDPSSDNIVRVQLSHLRRKLDAYFAFEGKEETLRVSIPRGMYITVFERLPAIVLEPTPTLPTESHLVPTPTAPIDEPADVVEHSFKIGRKMAGAVAVTILFSFLAGALWSRDHTVGKPLIALKPSDNAFLRPFMEANHKVSIILPDTSLLLFQTTFDRDLSLGDYINHFPDEEVIQIRDPELQAAFKLLASKRGTTFSEALIGSEFMTYFSTRTSKAEIRFARDLHVRDLSEGDAIIIGSKRANPWAQLFADRLNFQFTRNQSDHNFVFINVHPLDGEDRIYTPHTAGKDQVVSFVDVALIPNLSKTGSILLINGSDGQATDAAARFLLRGTVPDKIRSEMDRKDMAYFELLLRGIHIGGEAEDNFELVASRFRPS